MDSLNAELVIPIPIITFGASEWCFWIDDNAKCAGHLFSLLLKNLPLVAPRSSSQRVSRS